MKNKSNNGRSEAEITKINRIQSDFFGGLIEIFEPPLPKGVPERLDRIVASASINKGDTVLDVGSGTGILIPIIQSYLPKRVLACDLSDEMLMHLKEKFPFVHTFLGDVREMDEREGSIDVVLINACYPNIVDKQRSFSNIARMMKTGGRLVISHPMGKQFIEKLKGRSPFPLDDFPGRDEARSFLHRFGLKIVDFTDEQDIYLLRAEKTSAP